EPRAKSQTAAVPGVFYHLAATWDGEILALYVNGQLEGLARRPAPLASLTVLAQIGRGEQTDLAGNPFSGLIDELAIYNGALSACEIKNLFDGKGGGGR